MRNIEIKYDGKYPCLCMGHLIVIVDGIEYDFGECCLDSGGSVRFDEDWDEYIIKGKWSVKFPDNFPSELEHEVLDAINEKIPWGCCGGCI